MRGFYQWRGANDIQTSPAPYDGYQRYFWKDLEPSKNNYNGVQTKLVADMNAFLADKTQGRKFAFRIRVMGDASSGTQIPSYMISEGCSRLDSGAYGVSVPKWEDPCFTNRMNALFAAVKSAIDPYKQYISWVDIGMYGQWGEWSMYQTSDTSVKAPNSALRQIVDSHVAYFGDYHLVFFVAADKTDSDQAGDPLLYAMAMTSANKPA